MLETYTVIGHLWRGRKRDTHLGTVAGFSEADAKEKARIGFPSCVITKVVRLKKEPVF